MWTQTRTLEYPIGSIVRYYWGNRRETTYGVVTLAEDGFWCGVPTTGYRILTCHMTTEDGIHVMYRLTHSYRIIYLIDRSYGIVPIDEVWTAMDGVLPQDRIVVLQHKVE